MFAPTIAALRGTSTAFQTISENIANMATPGYKKADTRFLEVVSQGSDTLFQSYGGLRPRTQFFLDEQGTVEVSQRPLDVALQGKGFILSRTTLAAGGEEQLTRNGRLETTFVEDAGVDKTFITDVAGNFVLGWPADGLGGFTIGTGTSGLVPMRIDRDSVAVSAAATQNTSMIINLDADAATGDSFARDVGVFDVTGLEHSLKANFTKTATDNTWDVTFTITDGTVTAPAAAIQMTFNESGAIVSPTTQALSFNYTNTGGGTGAVTMDFSSMRQFAGEFALFEVQRDGNGTGFLESVGIDADGVVVGAFTNGTVRGLYKIPLTTVASPNLLALRDGTHYTESNLSGSLVLFEADKTDLGSFLPSAIEQSTVDLADEFAKMIVTQQSFNSSGNAFQTINDMLRVATDLKK
jgi:flagellar hook protein FlgE